MASYACTKCMHWFQFDQLSSDKQMCEKCMATEPEKGSKKGKSGKVAQKSFINCKYCQTDLKNKNIVGRDICDRCERNHAEHGEPATCSYCRLQSAFIGSKCQRCSSSQKKYGMPINCHRCNLKAAFDHSKARIEDLILCWLCYVTMQKDIRKKRKLQGNTGDASEYSDAEETKRPKMEEKPSASPNSNDQVWKQLFGEDSDSKTQEAPPKRKAKSPVKARTKSRDDLRKMAQENRKELANRQRHTRDKGGRKRSSSFEEKLLTFGKKVGPSLKEEKKSPVVEKTSVARKSGSNSSTPKMATSSDVEASTTPTFGSTSIVRNGSSVEIGKSGLPFVSDSNIVMVTQQREEINSLKKQLLKKDQMLLEKDKQISMLKVEHLREERSLQAKLRAQEEEFLKSKQAAMSKNHELLKKIAQLSKGKA